MKGLVICVLALFVPALAVEYDVGVDGNAGLGLSRWHGAFYNFEGVFVTDHLDSREPVIQVGIGLNVWLTESFGVHTGLHYGWYNYDYTYTTASDTLESGWSFRNLLLPVDLMYGFSLGNNRLVIGGGLSICRQLSGTLTELGNSYEIPDSLLETTIGPQVLVGFEIPTGRLTLCPSLKYVYGMDGLSARQLPLLPADQKISKHYILLCLGIFYSL